MTRFTPSTAAVGVTVPAGFRAAGITAGIKASGRPDMALVINDGPLDHAAAVFTRNQVVASPVKLTRAAVREGSIRAALYNSGNANACNGSQGDSDALAMVTAVAHKLQVTTAQVAVSSTGLIGDLLPMETVHRGIEQLWQEISAPEADSPAAALRAAEAIMTTDTVPKQSAVHSPDGWSVGGMGKGVGMMAPALATMLVCLTTDAVASNAALQQALDKAVARTFNTLDIDGSTSTNDTVVLLASGASGVTASQADLDAAVLAVCEDLARQLQADAEGVTKRVRIEVIGTSTDEQALAAARTIGRDMLVKCAMFGSDPNWGRVLAAVGMAEADMNPEAISVSFNGQLVCQNSTGVPGARDVDLSGIDIEVQVDLGTHGPGRAAVRTTDLSHQYVEINSAYST